MMLSRLSDCLPKIMSMSRNVSAKRYLDKIHCVPTMPFTRNSSTEQTSQLESIVDNLPQKDVKLMFQPYHYCLSIPNDSIRPYLLRAFNYWTNLPNDVIEILDQVNVMYYESAVLTDDIADESDYRRSFPTAHKIFGIPRAEISSRACFFTIVKKLLEINVKAAQLYVDSVLQHSSGHYRDINHRDSMICPTMEEYRQLSIDRTTPVMCLSMNLLQTLAGTENDFTRLLDLVGLHAQYLTDVSNLCDRETWERKGFCEDISEGSYTLITVHAINSGTIEGNIVSNILRQKTKDLPTKKYCLSLLEKLGSLDFAKEATVAVENELREEINRLGGNPLLVECIDRVNGWKYDEASPKDYKVPKFLNDSTS